MARYIFTVEAGRKLADTLTAHEAYSLAYETPHSVVDKIGDEPGVDYGSVVDSVHFSPKHPLWSRADFLKWAATRGRRASKMIRQSNNK